MMKRFTQALRLILGLPVYMDIHGVEWVYDAKENAIHSFDHDLCLHGTNIVDMASGKSPKSEAYLLITSFVQGNVYGAVIAPKGTEDLPKEQRLSVWRVLIGPLVEEVARHEQFPKQDADKVIEKLVDFCEEEFAVAFE